MNLPNKLSVARIVLIPFMIFFYLANFIPFGKVIAIVVFTIAAFTDLFDGRIARKRNLVTDFGKIADTLADKLLCTSALLLVCIDGTIPSPYGIIALVLIIGRDFLLTGFRSLLSSKGIVTSADMYGKVKAGVTMGVFPYLFFVAFWHQYNFFNLKWLTLTFDIIGYVGLAVVVLLTILSCVHYVSRYAKQLKEK